MTSAMRFDGIFTPAITPYGNDGSIDYAALSVLLDALVASGVHGVISGGSTGEYYAQSVEERLEVARFTCREVGGRIPVIVGTCAIRLPDSIAIAWAAAEMGADGIMIGTPPYALPTEQENAVNALAIDRAAGLPVMLYNYPGRMGVGMGEEFLDHVCRSPNIQAIKESSGDINRLHLLARDYPQLQLACGMDDQALEFFAWGARSWVCAGSNFLPGEHVALYRACVLQGDYTRGRRIMSAMLPLMRLLEQGGKFIQCVKHAVETTGRHAGPPRPPLMALSEDEKRRLEQVLGELKGAIERIEGEPA